MRLERKGEIGTMRQLGRVLLGAGGIRGRRMHVVQHRSRFLTMTFCPVWQADT
jgi:hypothetical protein